MLEIFGRLRRLSCVEFIIVEGGGICQCGKTGPGGLCSFGAADSSGFVPFADFEVTNLLHNTELTQTAEKLIL